jgi:hypothetical protein
MEVPPVLDTTYYLCEKKKRVIQYTSLEANLLWVGFVGCLIATFNARSYELELFFIT